MPFKVGQTYKDRQGHDIKIVVADSPLILNFRPYPIAGMNKNGHIFYYSDTGTMAYPGSVNESLIPPEPVRCQMKVYQYRDFRGGLVLTEGPLSEGWFLAMARQFEANRQKGCTESGLVTTIERILEG